ncbi:MAG: putative DNA binding domain-containing protein [Nitrospirae bacterium]|nr:putative DNA binding domain-containing protein [Nitrospirota bacterium]
MMADRTSEYLKGLLRELCALPRETEWVEFKVNCNDSQEIGEYISALSNSAALCGKASAYLIWGVKDNNHEIVGTAFTPGTMKKGNEELESWLLRLLSPRIHFCFYEVAAGAESVVILEIARASNKPVQFQGQEFIRIGSYKKKLKDYPEKERELWRIFDQIPFEDLAAAEHLSDEDVLKLLDYPSYFDLLGLGLPADRKNILQRLSEDDMISSCNAGGWNITNLGAILFAKKLDAFKHLKRKAVRVIVYKDLNRHETLREQVGTKGYASGFVGLIGFINDLLPINEVIGKALRKKVTMYPELAVRELVANAIIHQDFFIRGTGPMIEIFSDRMEITNPGVPLVKTERLLDSPPKSRNEALASFMRRIGICEERGSGVDKVVFQTEFYQLPAPAFEVIDENTRAVLYAHKPLTAMDRDDRIRACYLHSCLKHVNRTFMTNSSLRERFGIEEKNSAIASRIIKETLGSRLVRPYDEHMSKKYAKYVPFWA